MTLSNYRFNDYRTHIYAVVHCMMQSSFFLITLLHTYAPLRLDKSLRTLTRVTLISTAVSVTCFDFDFMLPSLHIVLVYLCISC